MMLSLLACLLMMKWVLFHGEAIGARGEIFWRARGNFSTDSNLEDVREKILIFHDS